MGKEGLVYVFWQGGGNGFLLESTLKVVLDQINSVELN